MSALTQRSVSEMPPIELDQSPGESARAFKLYNMLQKTPSRGVLGSGDRLLLITVALAQGSNESTWKGNKALCVACGMSQHTLTSHLHDLAALKLIQRRQERYIVHTAILVDNLDRWNSAPDDEEITARVKEVQAMRRERWTKEKKGTKTGRKKATTIPVDRIDAVVEPVPQAIPVIEPIKIVPGIPSTPDPSAHESVQLATLLFNYIGRRGSLNNLSQLAAMAKQLAPLLKASGFERVHDVMAWVFNEREANAVIDYAGKITGRDEPATYFAEQYVKNLERNFNAWQKKQSRMAQAATPTTALTTLNHAKSATLEDFAAKFERLNGEPLVGYKEAA